MAVRTRFVCPVLIGRDAELEVVRGAGREALRKRGQVVLLAGAAGMGKTAFLQRAAEQLQGDGLLTLRGAAAAAESSRPFGPFVDILRAAREALGPEAFDKTLRSRAFELIRLLPEMGTTPASALETGGHMRTFDSFDVLFGELAARAPVAVIVDDLHWADDATLSLFAYLARRAGAKRMLLIGAYRSDEIHRTHPLTPRLVEIERTATRIDLGRLDRAQIADLLRAALGGGREISARLSALLHERGEGNPFFTEELLKALATNKRLAVESDEWTVTGSSGDEVPVTVRAIVEARLASLPPERQRILRVAAVMGQVFDLRLLRDVTRVNEDEIIALLRAAIDAQLVDETDAPDTFRFRHALTREAIIADLLRHERATLHQAIGEAIERRSPNEVELYDRLAYHFDQAGDLARAARFHELAATESERHLAFADSIAHLERAIALRPERDATSADLRFRLALALQVVGQLKAALRTLEEAQEIYRALGDRHHEAAMIARSGAMLGDGGDTPGRDAAYDRAIAMLEPLGDSRQLANALSARALTLVITGRIDAGLSEAPRALAIAQRVGFPEAEMRSLQAIGLGLSVQGSLDAIPTLERALMYADQLPVSGAILFNNTVAALQALGIPRSEQASMRQRRRDHALKYGLLYRLQVNNFTDAFSDGRWDEALGLYADIRSHESRLTTGSSAMVACIEVARAGPAAARVDRDRARVAGGGSHAALHASWIAGAVNEIQDEAEWLYSHHLLAGNFLDRAVAALYGMVGATLRGSRDDRSRWIERLQHPPVGPREPIFCTVMRSVAAAEAMVDRGDMALALEMLGQAADRLASEDDKIHESVVRLRRAEIAAAADPDQARRDVNGLIEFWSNAGAAWFVGTLVKRADGWGLDVARPRTPRPKRTSAPLTDRELEVARLVADGLTNKQIAARLVVSERTAESHVERVREKLGVHSRTQIATWVTENALRAS